MSSEQEHPDRDPSSERTALERPLVDPVALEQTASRLGGALGRFARRAITAGEQAARDARPEAERLAERARAAAKAARPHVEQAGRDATRYVREHDREIRHAARTGAEIGARLAVPPVLRPVIDALEISQPPAPLTAREPDLPAGEQDSRQP